MDALITGLLKYASGAHDATPITVDCEDLLVQVTANLADAIRSADARVTHGILPNIIANHGIEEVFQNLIANGIKYARAEVRPEVHVAAEEEPECWHFTVRDNGVGIAGDYKAAIFEIFRRLHGREIPGSGIGLALSGKIVEGVGGEIWVESTLGAGSTFHFTVPKRRN